MYKIERFLLDHKFKKKKEYDDGVTIYSDYRVGGEYITEVAVFAKRAWELEVRSSQAVILRSSGGIGSDRDKEAYAGRMRMLADCQVEYAFHLKQWLDAIENPWELIE